MKFQQANLQDGRDFGERVLSIFLVKIRAAIFDVYSSGRVREVSDAQKKGEGRSRAVAITALPSPHRPFKI